MRGQAAAGGSTIERHRGHRVAIETPARVDCCNRIPGFEEAPARNVIREDLGLVTAMHFPAPAFTNEDERRLHRDFEAWLANPLRDDGDGRRHARTGEERLSGETVAN